MNGREMSILVMETIVMDRMEGDHLKGYVYNSNQATMKPEFVQYCHHCTP